MGFLTLVTAPATTPVSLSEAKAHLRVLSDDEDALINSLIVSATSAVQEDVGRALVTQTWDYEIPQPRGRVSIPLAPVASISSMTYFDQDDASQSLVVGDYYLFKSPDVAFVEPKDGTDWPNMKDRMDALKITFVAGQSAGNVDFALKQSVLLLLAHWFEGREGMGDMKEAPIAYSHLVSQHKLGWVG